MKALAAGIWLAAAGILAAAPPAQIRVATFNASLNRTSQGQLLTDLSAPASTGAAQIRKVAEVIQRVRPDVLLINEFDYDSGGNALRLFHDNFLAVPLNGQAALSYAYRYTAPSNTGIPSGFDLNNNGVTGGSVGSQNYGDDSFGFGTFPGQYGMAVYSRFPFPAGGVRTFQRFLWKDMPGAALPDLASTPGIPGDYYSAAELAVLRLSSKSHWDLPLDLGGNQTLHFLVSHPTPPVFDSTEDRNGRRNHDEIRFWADYIHPERSTYHVDDAGLRGGLDAHARFIIAGDMNADPQDGDSYNQAIRQLLNSPLIDTSYTPSSPGGTYFYDPGHRNDPQFDTADFSAGNLRADYVLPSRNGTHPVGGGIFWPLPADPLFALVSGTSPSDHRMVWVDLDILPIPAQAVQNLAITTTGDTVRLTWLSAPGHTCTAEESPDLSAGSWTDSTAIISGDTSGQYTATIAAPPPGRRYYRLRISFTQEP